MVSSVKENTNIGLPNFFYLHDSVSRLNNTIYFFKILTLSIPCAIQCICFSTWILTRSSTNFIARMSLGISVFKNEAFLEKGELAGKKAGLYVVVGLTGLFLSIIHPQLGIKALNFGLTPSLHNHHPLLNKPKKVTNLFYIWSKVINDLHSSPFFILNAGCNTFWFVSRSFVNIASYSLTGVNLLDTNSSSKSAINDLEKASRIFIYSIPILLIAFFNSHSALQFHKKYVNSNDKKMKTQVIIYSS